MKEEALKLADEFVNRECWTDVDVVHWCMDAKAMIRRLVKELDTTEKAYKWTEMARNAPTKPLSDEKIEELWDKYLKVENVGFEESTLFGVHEFARAIEAKVRGEK